MNLSKDYQKEKLTINLYWANIFSFLILVPIALIVGLPYYLLWIDDIDAFFSFWKDEISSIGLLRFFLVTIFGVIIHELIHGVTWARYTNNGFKSIKFGVLWKMLTPYCHCKEPLRVKHYVMGAIAPAIILGFIPSVVAIIIGNFGLLIFGLLFTVVAAGDFLIINLLRKENKDDFVEDHPSEAGCYIYRKIKK
jgi:hypothetical protein